MANKLHLNILKREGTTAWNRWRQSNPDKQPNLSGADVRRANLRGVDLSRAYLRRVDLRRANLSRANLMEADLSGANLSRANLMEADLSRANLSRANLSRANLMNAHLVETNFENTALMGCRIYGISAWGLKLQNAKQEDLIITRPDEPTITVDNLEVAQFIYLLLYNDKIRYIIDTITSKVVLILGRFTQQRKAVLDAIRGELRKHNYLPVLFDFEKPASRNTTETVSTLAHMARFVIADITDARSIPQELERIVPHLASVPVQPLLQLSADEYGLFEDLRSYPWVLEIYRYKDLDDLLKSLEGKVIAPAEAKATQLGQGG